MTRPPFALFAQALRFALVSLAGAAVMLTALGCTQAEQTTGDDVANAQAALVPADADALEAYLKGAMQQAPESRWLMATDATPAPAPPGTPGAPETEFSTTTLQTAGVDEADLVKFDGESLFVARQPVYRYPVPEPAAATSAAQAGVATFQLRDPQPEIDPAVIAVYAASDDPAEADEIATIELPAAADIDGMMLLPAEGGSPPLLVVIGHGRVDVGRSESQRFAPVVGWSNGRVRLWIFDVSDPGAPRALHREAIEGSLVAARRIRDQLVLVTRATSYPPYDTIDLIRPVVASGVPVESDPGILSEERAAEIAALDLQDLLPRRWIELPEDDTPRPLVRPEDCFVPQQLDDADAFYYYAPTLVTVSTIDLRRPEEPTSICAAGPVERIYSSTKALYLAATSWGWGVDQRTVVHKFAYTERGPEFRGSGRAEGRPGGSHPDFGMGEIGDTFGIMTTIDSATSFDPAPRLTLFAEAPGAARRLVEISHLPNEREPARIGKPGEQLYAVRFVGDRVYAVTFRRVDPLYVIDVEDVRNPFIAGELVIPGFSALLQPLTPDLLLGVGKDSIPEDGQDWLQGVKVELFDVSDPSDPVSVDSLIVGRRGTETPARHDHHALTTLDLGDGTSRAALPISVAETPEGEAPSDDPRTWHPWSHTSLHLFEVDHAEPALRASGELIVAEAGEDGDGNTWRDRSRLQGDAVHYVHEGRVWSAPWAQPDQAVGPQ